MSHSPGIQEGGAARFDVHLEYDRQSHRLLRVDASGAIEAVPLTPLEQRLVEYMVTRNRSNGEASVCWHRDLTHAVWPDRDFDDARSALAGLVLELRRKIERDPAKPRLMTTVNKGYALHIRPFCAVRTDSPFIAGPPIATPSRFFGRAREVDRLFSLWMHRPLHSAVVVGPARSGKTSLLSYLKALPRTFPHDLRPGQGACPLPHSAGGDSYIADAYRIVLISFQDPRMRRVDDVLGEILRGCGIGQGRPSSEEAFVTAIWSELDIPAIVLLDETSQALRRPELTELWGTLRSAASHHPHQLLAFVVACHTLPVDIERGTCESPLLNIISEILHLGPFTPDEAEELIAASPRPFPPEDIAWMLEHSGRWPALLQIFCDTRLNDLETGACGGDWRTHALRRAQRLRHLLQG